MSLIEDKISTHRLRFFVCLYVFPPPIVSLHKEFVYGSGEAAFPFPLMMTSIWKTL